LIGTTCTPTRIDMRTGEGFAAHPCSIQDIIRCSLVGVQDWTSRLIALPQRGGVIRTEP
jgi:hypothetical protein